MTKQSSYILWLPSWYPNEAQPFLGDFIQRHARAAALTNRVHVVFLTDLDMQEEYREERCQHQWLTEQVIYFRKKTGFSGKLEKQLTWKRLMLAAINKLFAEKGRPLGVHVHVPWKAGLIALYLKKKYGLQYIVTEHWGIYNHIVEDNFYQLPWYKRHALKNIFRNAACFLSVSKCLAERVETISHLNRVQVIPNVVDTSVFTFSEAQKSRFTFIHVSNMVPLKNVGEIIEAFHVLTTQRGIKDIQLLLVGNRNMEYEKKAKELGYLNRTVFFTGEIPYEEVARQMKTAHCLILNSNIENSPCVIGEALCCGLPVIATSVGGIPELVNENQGILIAPNDTKALVDAMDKMKKEYTTFNRKTFAAEASRKFSFAAVSKKFDEVYGNVFK